MFIEEVKGLNGVSGEEIRPICKIKDDFSFEIEDTSMYSPYEEGGYVMGANYY